MVDIAALENTLNEQLEAGLITDHEFRRIMSRATGGVWLSLSLRVDMLAMPEHPMFLRWIIGQCQ